MKPFLVILFLFLSIPLLSQIDVIEGQVLDADSNEPLAFVHVAINNTQKGAITSIDGRFLIESQEAIQKLMVSYVGYKNMTIPISEDLNQVIIELVPETKVLDEIEFYAGENPALPIIRNAISNARKNDPNHLKSYYYKSYNKFYVDAFNQKIDQDPVQYFDRPNPDSSVINFHQYLQDKYLFLLESVTEKNFKQPDLVNEKVLANKISGLQNNTFTTLANSFQPFSFYDKELKILGVDFLNPVSKLGMNKYFYFLQDSIINDQDTIYMISFEPEKENHQLLQGILYINTENWAIQNVIGEYEEPETFSLKIQQKYERIHNRWFPVQLNTDLIFNNLDLNGFQMKGVGRSYLYDIKLDLPVKSDKFNRMALEFDPKAESRSEAYWQQYRKEPMSKRGNRTFTYLDSVSQQINLDKIVKIAEKLLNGHVPVGFVDLPFNRMLRINEVEQLRLGIGIKTNEKLSKYFSLHSYFAYGLRDRGWKYGAGLDLFPLGHKDLIVDFKYSWDLMETGAPQFYQKNFNIFSTDSYRNLIVQLMDRVEMYQGGIHFYTLKYFDVYASLTRMQKTPYTNQYSYLPEHESLEFLDAVNTFNFTMAGVQLKYARTQYYPFLSQKIPVKDNYPVIYLNYYRGFDNLLQGEFEFNKLDFQLQKRFKIGLKVSDITVRAGWIDRPLPYTEQYFSNGSRVNDFSLFITNSFVTMPINQFLNDRYAALHFRQELLKIGNDEFYLQFEGHGSAGWGSLQNADEHSLSLQSMEKGYYEGGLSVSFPFLIPNAEWVLGSFYRLGSYQYPNWKDNLAFVYSLQTRF